MSWSVGGCRGLTGERVLKLLVWLSLLMAPSPLLNANVHNPRDGVMSGEPGDA